MAPGVIDYNALRAQTLGFGNDEEAVTVNTRALIDKVLARYSGEWTTLRELLQNAADASATKVTIRFETTPSTTVPAPAPLSGDAPATLKHVIQHHTLHRLVVVNDGQPFGENDWTRLKRIAEGNPDETKIGAFGVGFYSVFADCEEPFVSSGQEAMAFYWKGNSLFTRRLQLPDKQSPLTSFVLDYRSKGSAVPQLMQLCQFLATSLTFVGLQSIELWLDEWNIITLTKKAAPGMNIALPKDVETKTKEGIMKIASVEKETVQMDAKWMNIATWKPNVWSLASSSVTNFGSDAAAMHSSQSLRGFFSRLTGGSNSGSQREEKPVPKVVNEDLSATATASIFLRITTADVRATVSSSFATELERATKKPPPKKLQLAVLTASRAETAASTSTGGTISGAGAEIFASVLPTKSGRIFIGFPTHQTTSILAHISAHSVIPTVERESIDLNARYVRTWNVEVLRAAGIVCRIIWSTELADIHRQLSNGKSKPDKDEVARMVPDALHLFKQFTFQQTTPSEKVGLEVEEAFWTSNKKASIELLSSQGVLPSHEVRLATEDLSSFVQGIPVLPEAVATGAPAFVQKIKEFGLISEITVADVKKELEAKALDGKQLAEFLKWASRKAYSGETPRATIKSLLEATVASVDGALVVLADIEYYVNVSKIPANMPIPLRTIPFEFTKSLSRIELEAFGWEELPVVTWLRFLIEQRGTASPPEKSITTSATFAGQVLPIVSKLWDSLSQSDRISIVGLLKGQTVIPTRMGMKKPPEAYFATVKLFDDLPVVAGLQEVKDKILLALGVRKTVELSVIFERLLATPNGSGEGKWSHIDLIRYLASVRDDIPPEDIMRLRETPLCPAEEATDRRRPTSRRFKTSELYEPKDVLRALGLPILHWSDNYRSASKEGVFLVSSLSLQNAPTVPILFDIMAKAAGTGDMPLRDRAMTYFIDNHHANGYARFTNSASFRQRFLPVQVGSSSKLAAPGECFTNERAAVLGFPILRADLHPHATKFGVMQDPPMAECVTRLLNEPPQSRRQAVSVFGYLASRLGEINNNIVSRLGDSLIVPITTHLQQAGEKGAQTQRYTSPNACFLGEDSELKEIFDFVDFGHEANAFLLKCGSKHEPSRTQLAYIMIKDSVRLLGVFQNTEKYLSLLRKLADSMETLKKDKTLLREMKTAPFLLTYKEIPTNVSTGKDKPITGQADIDGTMDMEDDNSLKEWSLASAGKIVLVDDIISYNLFKSNLKVAPQEEVLEDFYHRLGSPLLSTIIDEDSRIGLLSQDQRSGVKLRRILLERSRLFLHDHPPEAIQHDSKWLEKNLSVQVVRSISLRRTLRGYSMSHTENRTAAVTYDRQKGWCLWITADGYDLFQVSQALVNLLLRRPKPHSTMMLEMLLSTDLLKLRARGYNVDRILRAKAAEARVAEEKRQKQLEEERRSIQELEKAWQEQQKHPSAEKTPEKQLAIPGSFNDTPEHHDSGEGPSEPTKAGKKPRNLFSSLTKRFGLDENRAGVDQPNGTRQNTLPPPPPYSSDDPNKPAEQGNQTEGVTPSHQLHKNLVQAIGASQSFNASNVISRPETNNVKETSSYCDERPGHDMSFLADTSSNIRIFLSNSVQDRSGFLSRNSAGLNRFAKLLVECGDIFALPQGTLHIYHDEAGSTIAFNRAGALFCNYRFFEQLHLRGLESGQAEKRGEALVYWWVVLCHELSHNLVGDHSSAHSYWTENFVAQYFPKVMAKLAGSSTSTVSGGAGAPSLLD